MCCINICSSVAMSQNCKSGYPSAQRDANNNMYTGTGCTIKGYGGSAPGGNKAYQVRNILFFKLILIFP